MLNSLEKVNPALKLIGLVMLTISFVITNNYYGQIIAFVLLCAIALFNKTKIIQCINMVLNIIFVYLAVVLIVKITFFFNIDPIMLTIKIVSIMLVCNIIISRTSNDKLALGLVKIINIFNIMAWDWSNLDMFLYQLVAFFKLFEENKKRILASQSLRGIDIDYTFFLGRLRATIIAFPNCFRITLESLRQNKINLEQKLFDFNTNRSKINLQDMKFYDIIFLGIVICLIAALFLGDIL